jgi:hypothetical protein
MPGARRTAALRRRLVTSGSTVVSNPFRSRLEPTSTWPSSVVSMTVLIFSRASSLSTAAM